MAAPKRLIIAGMGLVGKRHADAMLKVRDVQLCAIVDPNEAVAEDAAKYAVPHYRTLQAAFANEQIDGVVLSTPTPLHIDQALECLAQQCAVLIEKPLATSSLDAATLLDEAERRNVPVLVGHHRRHNPLIKAAKAMIDRGDIGQIRAVHSQCWFYKPDPYYDQAPWRKKRGAGPISVNLVHDVDLIRHLCGEIISVQAQASPSLRGFENEDVAAALLSFKSGAIGTITVSDAIASPWSWELTSGEYPVYPKTDQSAYTIGGSLGSLSVPDLRLWRHDEAPDWWSPIAATTYPRANSDPLVNQIEHFAAVLRGDSEPLVSAREGYNTLRVIEAIAQSAQSGQAVHLTPSEPSYAAASPP